MSDTKTYIGCPCEMFQDDIFECDCECCGCMRYPDAGIDEPCSCTSLCGTHGLNIEVHGDGTFTVNP